MKKDNPITKIDVANLPNNISYSPDIEEYEKDFTQVVQRSRNLSLDDVPKKLVPKHIQSVNHTFCEGCTFKWYDVKKYQRCTFDKALFYIRCLRSIDKYHTKGILVKCNLLQPKIQRGSFQFKEREFNAKSNLQK